MPFENKKSRRNDRDGFPLRGRRGGVGQSLFRDATVCGKCFEIGYDVVDLFFFAQTGE